MNERDELRELVGNDVPASELERLERAHDALRASDPPPEVPDHLTARVLAIPEARAGGGLWLRRRRLAAGLAIAAAIGGAAFGLGFWAGGSGDGGVPVAEEITLTPTPAGPAGASMVVDVLPRDEAGNWRMLAHVSGLRPLGEGGYYEVWLVEDGKALASCGRFVVDENGAAQRVWLNAPYTLKGYERWAVRAHDPESGDSVWLLDGPVVTPA
jgi:hypothetical protein